MIYLRRSIVEAIFEHARNPSPARHGREVCGRILARGETAVRYEPLVNRARGDGRWTIRPTDWRLRPLGQDVWMTHSHPWGTDGPSPDDLKRADVEWLEVPYGIVTVTPSGECELRFWLLHRDREGFTPMPHVVLDDAPESV